MDNLLKEWNEIQTKKVKSAIVEFMRRREGNVRYNYDGIDQLLGLAYTSSSSCAGLWICNIAFYMDAERKLSIRGFVLDVSGWVYALCEDKDENQYYIKIK